jgi:Ca2+-binding EF-hand superfamily protein
MNKLLPITIVAFGFSTAALAQAPSFEEVDANQDGMISAEEAAAVEGLDFATADTNQDGVIDRAEYSALTEQ